MKNKRISTICAIALLVIALIAAGIFALLPSFRQTEQEKQQQILLASIEQGDGSLVWDPVYDFDILDYYEDASDEYDRPQSVVMVMAPETEAEPSGSTQGHAPASPETIMGIGVLEIKKIDLKLPVVDGVSKNQLKVAVGRVPQTAQIGAIGNAVIAGHRSYRHGQFFNRLGEVEVGDQIQYTDQSGNVLAFTVFEIVEIEPGDQAAFVQPDNRAQLTLLTCTILLPRGETLLQKK